MSEPWWKVAALAAWNWIVRYPFAAVVALLVLVVAVLALATGIGRGVNWGGIIGALFGRKPIGGTTTVASNTPPPERVDREGKPIPPGVPDERGWTQREAKEFVVSGNPLRDKGKIEIDGTPVPLPIGVRDSDVKAVVEVRPQVYVVEVRDGSGGSAADLLKKLPIVLLLPILLQAVPSWAQDQVCLPKDQYEGVKAVVAKMAKIETSKPVVSLDPVVVVEDADGRVYANEAAGKLSWGDLEADLRWTPAVVLRQVVPPDWGLRVRVRLSALLLPSVAYDSGDFRSGLDVALALEPIYWKLVHAQVHAGTRSVGVGLGLDLTRNLDVYLGFALPYAELGTPTLVVGTGVSVN